MIELESKKRMESLKQSIETATGESYEDFTGAVKALAYITKLFNRTKRLSFYGDSEIESIDIYLAQPIINASEMFSYTPNLKTMVGLNTSQCTEFSRVFYGSGIVSIQEPFDISKATGGAYFHPFRDALNLVDIRFVLETIKVSIQFGSRVLSGESIQSIFGGLNTEATGNTLTLRQVAVKKAFETSEGANDGDTSETWNALVASKPNWTITLN